MLSWLNLKGISYAYCTCSVSTCARTNLHFPVYVTWRWLCECACVSVTQVWNCLSGLIIFPLSTGAGRGSDILLFFFCLFFKLSMLLLLFSNHSLWNPEFSKSCLIIKSPIWCFACLWHHFNKCVLTQEKLCHQYVVCHMLCSSSFRIWYIFKSSHEAKLTQTVCDNIIVLWSFQGCKPYNAKVWEVALKLTLSH